MSHLIKKEIACQFCQFPNQAELWTIINAKEDPELKDLLMGGELNLIECESCKEIFYVDTFLIYHDPDVELMAFVYPLSHQGEKEKWIKKTHQDYTSLHEAESGDDIPAYEPVTLFGLDALVHMVNVEEDVKIQSEIVAVLSRQHNLKVKTLSTFEARVRSLPPVLPFQPSGMPMSKRNLLAGLQKICALNDRLGVYKNLADRLSRDPTMEIQIEGALLK